MEIKILCCKGKINDIDKAVGITQHYEKKYGITLLLLDPGLIYGKDHIESAVQHAIRAFREKRNTSHSLSLEILLYASGKTQLKDAIEFMGIKKTGPYTIICVGKTGISGSENSIPRGIDKLITDLKLESDNFVLTGNKEILYRFGFTDTELKTVDKSMYQDLILERVAMVDVLK